VSRIAFLDFETTGLSPLACEPIEVAVVITDDAFTELDAFSALIYPERAPYQWEPAARAMHDASGLTTACIERGAPREFIGRALASFIGRHRAAGGVLHLAGNSVHFDRSFLALYWPRIADMFHHRHLDVSSVRMLGERVTRAPQLGGDRPHRAMQDVRRSIAELKHWTAALRTAA
jgi:oligoribonuclease